MDLFNCCNRIDEDLKFEFLEANFLKLKNLRIIQIALKRYIP